MNETIKPVIGVFRAVRKTSIWRSRVFLQPSAWPPTEPEPDGEIAGDNGIAGGACDLLSKSDRERQGASPMALTLTFFTPNTVWHEICAQVMRRAKPVFLRQIVRGKDV